MATSMTHAQLRGLARLYRQGVDGALEQLAMIVKHNAQELPEALGVPLKNLHRLAEHDDPVAVLVATIEGAPRVAREMREKISYDTAATMAVRLAETAQRRAEGHYSLDVDLLGEIVTRYPGRVITFGTRGSCGSRYLRAVLRELRHVRATSVVLTRDHIAVMYEGDHSRGLIRLVLHAVVVEDAVVVPIDLVGQRREHVGVSAPVLVAAEDNETPPEPVTAVEEVDRVPEPVSSPLHDAPSRHDDAPGRVLVTPVVSTTPETKLGQRRGERIRILSSPAVRHVFDALAAALGAP